MEESRTKSLFTAPAARCSSGRGCWWQRGCPSRGTMRKSAAGDGSPSRERGIVVVSLPFCPLGCASHANFLGRDVEPIEPLRLGCSGEVGQGQNAADTIGHG